MMNKNEHTTVGHSMAVKCL